MYTRYHILFNLQEGLLPLTIISCLSENIHMYTSTYNHNNTYISNIHVQYQALKYIVYMYMYVSMYMCTSNVHYITYNVCIHVHVYFQCVLCINTNIGKICQCSCSKVWTSTKIKNRMGILFLNSAFNNC